MKFDIYFLGFRKEIFFGGITDNTIAVKNVKKNVICLKLFWYKVFVDWKLKLLNFLLDSISVLNVFEITFMFSYSNDLMILTIGLQSRDYKGDREGHPSYTPYSIVSSYF